MRIRFQLAASIFVTGCLGLTALLCDRAVAVHETLYKRSETRARAMVESLESLLLNDMRDGNARSMTKIAQSFSGLPGVAYVQIIDRTGRVVVMESKRSAPRRGTAGMEEQPDGLIEVHSAMIDPSSKDTLGGIQLAMSTERLEKIVRAIALRGLAVGGPALIILALAAWYIGVLLGRRLESLSEAVERMEGGEALQLEDGGTDSEVDRLSRRFAALNERLASEKAARVKLEAFKDDLTDMLIHDMKHPITVLGATLALLTDADHEGFSKEKIAGLAAMGRRAISRENAMIEEMLQLSRLNDAEVPLRRTRLPLRPFLEECAAANAVIVEQSQLRWRLDIADDVSGWIYGDSAVLKRLIGNLVLNAVEHSPAGGLVTLGAKLCERDRSKVELLVRDEGPGVAPELREKIFERHRTFSESAKNVGLGLAFCKMAAEKQSAQLKLLDLGGVGATFAVVMPVFREQAAPKQPEDAGAKRIAPSALAEG